MQKTLKIFISSVFIALSCLVLQTAHGTEDCEQGVKQPPVSRVSRGYDTEDPQRKKGRYEETRENPFEECPEEITFIILELAAIGNYLSNGNTGSLILVCRDWRCIMALLRKDLAGAQIALSPNFTRV